ncbi:MAG TPA: lipopolysaccharide kinase InaA family protein [Gemmatimonadaceae bacterium]
MSVSALPSGYSRSRHGPVTLVAREWASAVLRQALQAHGSLFRWAEAQRSRDELRGRGVTWATILPPGPGTGADTPVVVRHTRHGGLFAPLTGDLFLLPTRAPRELSTAVRLSAGGVPTPEVIAYAVHPVGGILARSDMMTRRLPHGSDLPDAWRAACPGAARDAIIDAVATLLRALSALGAQHADLNVKNVYIAGEGAATTAYVLDVDRVRFVADGNVSARNFARFARSARKWNAERGLDLGDDALVRLATRAWVDQ